MTGIPAGARAALVATWLGLACSVAEAQLLAARLADLSLEELSGIEVTSATLRRERLADTAAAVHVITGEDIRRAGVTSLPEALRLANIEVARVNSYDYAVSTRAFGAARANKLLVMIDGRTVYSPLFSGVFWDAQDVVLEDVERIEVISGPGGVTWGSNAVMGVINVITRSAVDTRGTLASAGVGNRERSVVGRHGGRIAGGHYRFYAKGFDRDGTRLSNGAAAMDAWQRAQAGFRADWEGAAQSFTLQGDIYGGRLEQPAPGKRDISGANVLARWSRRLGADSDLAVRAYLDHTEREHPGVFGQVLDIADVHVQHNFRPAARHQLAWGGSYRHADDRVSNTPVAVFMPAHKTMHWTSVFAEDEVTLTPQLRATLGLRVERNPYTGTESMPSARLGWKPHESRLVWAAASRAVRSPSRIDRELALNPPFVPVLVPNPGFRSETSDVLELGYRAQATPRLAYSATLFHHRHRHLRSVETRPDGTSTLDNKLAGTTRGVEASLAAQPTQRWRLRGALTLVRQRLHAIDGSTAAVSGEGNDPSHRWMLRSGYDFDGGVEADLTLRRAGALPDPAVPAYTALDARLGWRRPGGLEFSVALQNLLDPRHEEFGAPPRSVFGRSVFAKVTWRH